MKKSMNKKRILSLKLIRVKSLMLNLQLLDFKSKIEALNILIQDQVEPTSKIFLLNKLKLKCLYVKI